MTRPRLKSKGSVYCAMIKAFIVLSKAPMMNTAYDHPNPDALNLRNDEQAERTMAKPGAAKNSEPDKFAKSKI